ncbi:hypothetical protein F2Y83_17185 [Bacteroides cellulosilyticus]|nr:hypothetical protein F2Y70_13005 [Bacteroides cellulosilyticus]KAA5433555.1 hypothetical protein F2Y83_17185 [Bacteroides cellulosilyticus]KAA5433920.1 hypothetical protein F2Y74_18815 [Bacteroides cellulosilyticus]KAA5444544.1 hypothetical protein F2Y53_16810 [Bacteroides cellulosilyticus]
MANPINHPRYSAKNESCEAPIPNAARIPARMGMPQQLTIPKNANTEDRIPATVDQTVFLLLIFPIFSLLYIVNIR